MKLHLPKGLRAALLACMGLLAPLSATVSVADEVAYSGTIYTWKNTGTSTADLATGAWAASTLNADGTYTYGSDITGWSNISPLIGVNNTNDRNTLRFDSSAGSNGTMNFTFGPLAIAGFIVESGTTGYSIVSGGTASSQRSIYIGNNNETEAFSTIHESFSISNAASTNTATGIFLRGTQTITIDTDKTLTLNAGNHEISISGNLTLSDTGTLSLIGGSISNSGTLNLGSKISINRAIANTGTINAATGGTLISFDDVSGFTYVSSYSDGANGYIQGYEVDLFGSEGTQTGDFTVSYQGGSALNVVDGKVTLALGTTDTLYIINEGDVVTSASTSAQNASGFRFDGENTSLTIDSTRDTSWGNIEMKATACSLIFAKDATIGTISTTTQGSSARNITVNAGVSVTATEISNNWGMGTLTVNGNLTISGTLKLSSNGSTSEKSITGSGVINAGTLNFGNTDTYNIDVAELNVSKIYNNFYGAILNITGGHVTTETLELADNRHNSTCHLTIADGATLKVTGGDTNSYKTTGIELAEWGSRSEVTVNGTMIAENASVQSGDKGFDLTIGSTGTLLAKGVGAFTAGTGKATSSSLTLQDGGRLILGTNALNSTSSTASLNVVLEGGTIASYADSITITKALSVAQGKTVKIDSSKYAVNGNEVVRGTESSEITIGGALALGGTLQIDGSGSVIVTGSITAVDGGGSVQVESGASLTLNSAAALGKTIESDGTLTLGTNGSLTFSAVNELESKGTSYHDTTTGAIAGNGYESGDYYIIKGSGTITGITSGTTTVSVGGADFTVTVDSGNATITNVGTSGFYYINSGEVTYGDADNAADADATDGLVLNGGDLVMKKALVATEGIIVMQSGSLTINEGVTLDKVQIDSGNLTLKGSGVYNMSGATADDAAATQVDNTWTGTINLSDSTIGSLANLNHLSSSGSTLNLDGNVTASTGTTAANMELKDGSSLSLSGTGDSAFSGKLTGTGSISDTSSGSVSFTGDILGWTGSYTGTDSTVKFAAGAAVNASISGKSMELGSGASLNKGATLTGNMTASDFTLGGSLTVGGDMTATSITIGDGVLKNLGTNTPLINVSGSLSGIDFVLGDSNWKYLLSNALGEGAAYKLVGFGSSTGSFTLNNGANSYVKDGVKFYIASTDSAVTLTKVTMGPEWRETTGAGWTSTTGFTPQQSSDGPVCFLGNGSALVQVHGAQKVTGINVDAESGVTTYTLTGDSVTTNTLSIIHGNLIIQNELTANGLISIHSGTELTVKEGGTLTGGSMANNGTLTIGSGSTVTVGSLTGDGSVAGDGILVVLDGKVSEKTLSTNAGTIEMNSLNDEDATQGVSGTLLVREGGSYTGAYNGATSIGTSAEGALQKLRADELLTVIGDTGTVELTGMNHANAADNKLGGLDTTGASVKLDNKTDAGAPTKVTLGSASSMEGGVLDFKVSATEVNNNLSAAKENKPTVITGEKLDLSNVTLKVHEVQNENLNLALGEQEKDILLFVVSDNDGSMVNNVTVNMDDCPWMTKYFTNFRVVEGSVNVIGDANTGLYAAHGQTPNGTAGLALAGKAMFHVDPQTRTPGSELAQVLDMLDNHIASGNTGAMDKLGAALAGSSLSAVGLALADDVQRQLRSIRNRTTTMGVNECVVNEDMPYVNGWISGDGNYRQLSESGTDAGYQVSSWGGTVGVDVDVNPNLTLGVAVSALFGDYTGKAADTLTGDLDTQYVSLFARVSTGSWVNTFVGTLGRADVDLERTLPGIAGKTTYKTNGMMFGFLYEIARTFALNEDASTCVQPLFNMSFTHTSLDSATEGGTADTRLTTDSASLTQFSLGLGGRLQSIVGENEYNRASIFEARALLKLDFGDRYNKLNTALAALPNASVGIRSNESGVIGGEVGATLTIPLSQDAGSVFFDVNADFRADEVGVNGSVGYRVNF